MAELLKVLEDAEWAMTLAAEQYERDKGHPSNTLKGRIEMARAAIAKARGE